MSQTKKHLVTCAADLVAAYVAHNHVAAADLPDLLTTVHGALCGLGQPSAVPVATEAAPVALTPAQIRKSITPAALISFEDGRPYKMLKRHLTAHGLDPASYRARFGLPPDYPMAAASYAERRAEIAREIGLGRYGSMARRAQRQAAE